MNRHISLALVAAALVAVMTAPALRAEDSGVFRTAQLGSSAAQLRTAVLTADDANQATVMPVRRYGWGRPYAYGAWGYPPYYGYRAYRPYYYGYAYPSYPRVYPYGAYYSYPGTVVYGYRGYPRVYRW